MVRSSCSTDSNSRKMIIGEDEIDITDIANTLDAQGEKADIDSFIDAWFL